MLSSEEVKKIMDAVIEGRYTPPGLPLNRAKLDAMLQAHEASQQSTDSLPTQQPPSESLEK